MTIFGLLNRKKKNQKEKTTLVQPDMENVPSKPSAAQVIFFGTGKFWV